MRSVEKSAKVYEDALEAALQELNASISDVNVEVLEEGSKGLFGLFGSRPYKIRVTVKEEDSASDDDLDVMSLLSDKKEQKPERRPKQKAETPKPAEPAQAAEEKPAPEKKPAARRPEPVRRQNPDRKPAAEAEPQAAPAAEAAEPQEAAPVEAIAEEAGITEEIRQPRKSSRNRRKGGRKNSENGEHKAEDTAEERKPLPPKPVVKPLEKPVVTMIPAEELDPESAAGRAKAFLQELTRLMGVEVDIQMGTDAEGNVFGYMTGDTLGVLIGRRGETLDAVQYLTSLRVNRGQEGYLRVTLDTENYRAKREDTLIRLANRMANRAVKTGRRVALEPMNPYERRIIHSALQSYEAVDTHSEGDEPNRHVVITLRK